MFKTRNLYQNDAKWENVKLGNSFETIGGWGSLLTSITMMLNGIGYHETPATVNEKLKQEGGFLKALLIPSCVPYIWPNCAYHGMQRCEDKLSAPIAQIDAEVAAGRPVILQVDAKEEEGIQTHFVLVKEKRGSDYVLYDPHRHDGDRPGRDVLLISRYKHNYTKLEPESSVDAKLASEISAVLWFGFHNAALPKPPKVARVRVPSRKHTVYAVEDGLALRAQPSVDGYPRKLLVMGTELICLEPEATVKARLSTNGQWLRVQDPKGEQGFVAAWLVNSTYLPTLAAPRRDALPPRKKWCLKNVVIEEPRFETWDLNGETQPNHKPAKSFSTLLMNTVVNVLNPNVVIPGDPESSSRSGIAYQKTYRDSVLKKWVTTRVTGWVKDADLEDYCEDEREEFQKFVVRIRHQTENSTDAQQYLYIQDENGKFTPARYNMCGELCIASIIEQDIDAVLAKWKERSLATFNKMVGKADKPLGRPHIEELIQIHIGPIQDGRWERYKLDRDGNALPSDELDKAGIPQPHYIQLAFVDKEKRRVDQRRASEEFQAKLRDFYFITNLRIDTNNGDLIDAAGGERNHWVVVDKVTRNGGRVELYNPFPNRRQEYTFGEFYQSIGGNPNTGWWIDRNVNPTFRNQKTSSMAATDGNQAVHLERDFQPPRLEVAIDTENKTPDLTDAEQYIKVEGLKKTNLCGEFCISFILTQSMQNALTHWLENQESLKQQGEQPADLDELVNWLDAYGFINRKTAPDQSGKIKSFTIDTVLKYWKTVQPDLYNSILGGSNNETTGPADLKPILQAYGYRSKDQQYSGDFTDGSLLPSPSKTAEKLKTHFLMTGVNISAKKGGILGGSIAHWVVVDKITPIGNLVGGNGGWVELYNPFLNRWEEYSYREFMKAYLGSGLWVRRDVSPVFSTQLPVGARSKAKKESKNKGKAADKHGDAKPGSAQNARVQKFADRLKDGESPEAVAKALANKLNMDPETARKLLGLSTASSKPRLDINKLVRKRFKIDSIPREIGFWLRGRADDDPFRVEQLTDALRQFGIFMIDQQNKKSSRIEFERPVFSAKLERAVQMMVDKCTSAPPKAREVARTMASDFACRAVEEIRQIHETMPVQAYKNRAEFLEWTRGLASTLSHPIDEDMKKRIFGLSVPRAVVPRFDPGTIEEIRNIRRSLKAQTEDKSEYMKRICSLSDSEFVEWTRGLAANPRSNVYRVRRWGDPVMKQFKFDINIKNNPNNTFSSNFQAIGLYNEATGFGAVSNYLIIPPEDVLKLENLQLEDEYQAKVPDWLHQKMNWLCQERGSIYMFAGKEYGESPWRRPDGIRWGTLALGGNLVQVAEVVDLDKELETPSGKKVKKLARLVGFRHDDWNRPLDDLLAEGLMHRCFSVNSGNSLGDSPKGIVYSPFWSIEEWEFMPKQPKKPTPTALYIPFEYLEPKVPKEIN